MNLYLIWHNDDVDYEAYRSAVVAANTSDEAKLINPSCGGWNNKLGSWFWAKTPETVECKLVGEASEGTCAGIVLTSDNLPDCDN